MADETNIQPGEEKKLKLSPNSGGASGDSGQTVKRSAGDLGKGGKKNLDFGDIKLGPDGKASIEIRAKVPLGRKNQAQTSEAVSSDTANNDSVDQEANTPSPKAGASAVNEQEGGNTATPPSAPPTTPATGADQTTASGTSPTAQGSTQPANLPIGKSPSSTPAGSAKHPEPTAQGQKTPQTKPSEQPESKAAAGRKPEEPGATRTEGAKQPKESIPEQEPSAKQPETEPSKPTTEQAATEAGTTPRTTHGTNQPAAPAVANQATEGQVSSPDGKKGSDIAQQIKPPMQGGGKLGEEQKKTADQTNQTSADTKKTNPKKETKRQAKEQAAAAKQSEKKVKKAKNIAHTKKFFLDAITLYLPAIVLLGFCALICGFFSLVGGFLTFIFVPLGIAAHIVFILYEYYVPKLVLIRQNEQVALKEAQATNLSGQAKQQGTSSVSSKLEAVGVPITAFRTYVITFILGMLIALSSLLTLCSYVNVLTEIAFPDELVAVCKNMGDGSSSGNSAISYPTLGSGTSGSTAPLVDTSAKQMGYGKDQTESDAQAGNSSPVVPVDQRYNDASSCDALTAFDQTRAGDTRVSGKVVAQGRDFFIEKLEDLLAKWHQEHPNEKVIITSMFRSAAYEQKLGETNPLATGVKFSSHSAGFAFDFNYNQMAPATRTAFVAMAQEFGFYWGGNFKDPLHFDLANPSSPPACANGASDRRAINKNCAIQCA